MIKSPIIAVLQVLVIILAITHASHGHAQGLSEHIPSIQYGGFILRPSGRIHFDFTHFESDMAPHQNGTKYRRARLGATGQITPDMPYKIDVELSGQTAQFRDAHLTYRGIAGTALRVGNFKPGLSLEDLTSSNDITFIERSAPTSAFVAGQILGTAASFHGENWMFSSGIFIDKNASRDLRNEAWYASMRGTYLPVNKDTHLLHIGASFGQRQANNQTNLFDFDANFENSYQRTDSVSAKFGNAESSRILGLEALQIKGPLSMQVEYYLNNVDRSKGFRNVMFHGGYAQIAWTATGERRPYKIQDGIAGRISPEKPFNPKNGSWGALELAARYSLIDLTDHDISGGSMNNITLGLNWYLNDTVRLMANYIRGHADAKAVTPNNSADVLILRGQLNW